MPGALKKTLYIGSSLEELNRKVDHNVTKGQTSKIYARSANTVLSEAEKADKSLDEERAYVLFMKYLALWKAVKAAKDYKQNKDYVDALLGTVGCRKAIDKAEELSASLNLRYSELEEAKEASKKIEEEKERVKANGLKDGKTKDGEEKSVENGVPEEEKKERKRELGKDGAVNAIVLYKELESNPNSVLIMDVRRSDHFKDSHMTIGQCISIPAEILTPGMTAATLEKGLGEEAKVMWKQRTDMEFIVLVDWDQCQRADSTLAIVEAAMCKWDWGTTYKNPPLVLKGGYEDWLFKYPMYTNNPQAKKPAEKVEETKNLLDFEYPVFDDDKPPPPALPSQQLNNVPTSHSPSEQNGNGNGGYQNRMFYISGKPGQTGQTGQRPVVNRSVKPGTTNPDPVAPNRDETDSSRDKPKFAPAPVANLITNNLESKTIARTPDLAKSGPASSTTKPTSALPAVNRNLKPKIENSAANLNEKDTSDTAAYNTNGSELGEDSSVSLKEFSLEAGKKSDIHLEELKKKEEQARNDLNKMRYDKTKAENDKTKAENEKLKEEKLEMESNLLKLQKELAEAKARQEQRKRTPQKTSSPSHNAQSPSPMARKQDATDSGGSSSSDAAPRTASSTSASSKKVADDSSNEPAVDRNAAQPNQNSNAASAEVKSVTGASSREASTSSSASSSASAASPPPVTAAVVGPTLPQGWEKRWDEKSRRYFYLDHNTSKTQWHIPGEPAPKTMADQGPSRGASTAMASPKPKGDTPSSRPSGQVTRMPLKSDSVEPSAKSSGLKRSYSSPNIAQMVMNEGEATFNKPFPSVDRSTKPAERSPQAISQFKSTANRARQLNPIFGNQGRALTGLRNLGNTCFMNSVVQCLSNTTPLAKYFITDDYLQDINRANPLGRGGEVAEEFAVVVRANWSGQYRSIAPRDLRDTVTKYVPEFRKHVGHHHDSQEFLLFLLDGLHEDLNEVKKRQYIKEEDFSKYPDHEAAGLSWRNHEKLNRSIIVSLFQGQFKSTVRCLSCNNKSVKFEAFMYLSLPIASKSKCSLHECLQQFSKPEELTGDNATHCTHCKGNRKSEKTILIWKLPHILLIHLKRFYYEGMWRQKLQTNVDFPNDLTMDRYVIGPAQRNIYQLYGVSNHSGTLDGGHYTACCRNAVNKRWYKYDDHEVYDASKSSIKSSAAYILFYSSLPLTPP
eukprot:XP_784858.2 PREDICTED: ubiquitin carboxyl-terminal hydrolase 8 [Strongylocentrotus purpuratus]